MKRAILLFAFIILVICQPAYSKMIMYATDPTNPGGDITMIDDDWIGLGSAAGRLTFMDESTDILQVGHADVRILSDYCLQLGSNNNVAVCTDEDTAQTVWNTSATGGNQIIIGSYLGNARDYDHASQTNPTIFVHSATDPNTNNTQWISLAHDTSYGVINWGSGGLKLAGEDVYLIDTGDDTELYIDSYDDDATDNAILFLRSADNTFESPAAIDSGDYLGQINFEGHDGSAFVPGANIVAVADTNWSASEHGTDIWFQTVDGAGGLATVLALTAEGYAGFQEASPNAVVEISGNGSTAFPVLMISSDDDNDGDYFIIEGDGDVGFGTGSPQGNQQWSSADTHGGYVWKIYSATSGALTGATDKIELDIPSGWIIKACQLHVKTAVVDDAGNDTWSSELNDGGQEEVLSAGSAASQNTNVQHIAHADAGYGGTLTDAETDILLTPNGGNFTQGEIEADCLCLGFDTWDNES